MTPSAIVAGMVARSLYDEYTALVANSDNTPEALAFAAGCVLGRERAGGDLAALNHSKLLDLLSHYEVNPTILQSGLWYDGVPPGIPSRSATAATPTADRLYARPYLVTQDTVWDYIGLRCDTAVAGGKFKLGVYDITSAGKPGNRLLVTGEFTTTANGDKTEDINLSLSAGIYFLAMRSSGITTGKLERITVNDWRNGGNSSLSAYGYTAWYTDDGSYAADAIPDPWPGSEVGDVGSDNWRIQLKMP